MCTRPITLRFPATMTDMLHGYYSEVTLKLPCGKCQECMQKRRNSIVFRCYNEAKKRGKMDFVTLTYNDESLPISHSLWSVDSDTGELTQYGVAEIPKYIPERIREGLLGLSDMVKRHEMRWYLEEHPFNTELEMLGETERFYNCYVPSHNFADVKRLLKIVRKYYEKQVGRLADFTYLVVPEFGENYSRRPHYHMCLFGADDLFVQLLTIFWSKGAFRLKGDSAKFYDFDPWNPLTLSELRLLGDVDYREVFPLKGFAYWEKVRAINLDGSDGFAKVASYVGKYVGKGQFEDSLIKQGFVNLPRISISKHFGKLPQSLVDWHLCRDLYGQYDDEALSGLSKEEISLIASSVGNRLYHSFQAYDYALPLQFRKQIFKGRFCQSPNSLPSYLKGAEVLTSWPASGKYVYSRLYYEVSYFIRDKLLQAHEEEFRQFVLHSPAESMAASVAAFEAMQQIALKIREETAFERYKTKLSKSKF